MAVRLQLRSPGFDAAPYWFAVMMVAVFGTMAADSIRHGAGVGYGVTTPVFAVVVAAIFALWYADGFSKPTAGGLHLGEGTVSAVALVGFVALVAYVVRRERGDQPPVHARRRRHTPQLEFEVQQRPRTDANRGNLRKFSRRRSFKSAGGTASVSTRICGAAQLFGRAP